MGTFEEIFRDSWFYQDILEKGRQQGFAERFAEGFTQGLEQGMQLGILSIIRARFPDIAELAQQRIEAVHDAQLLWQLITKMALASTAEEARHTLLELPDGNA